MYTYIVSGDNYLQPVCHTLWLHDMIDESMVIPHFYPTHFKGLLLDDLMYNNLKLQQKNITVDNWPDIYIYTQKVLNLI